MFSQIGISALSFAMAVLFGLAIVDDSPAITAELEPWLDQVEIMRAVTEDLSDQWQDASPAEATEAFAENAHAFVALTETTSSNIRALEPGNDAACILHGMGLDIGLRLEALAEAVDGATTVDVLNGIDRLLFEGLLIFGRQHEAGVQTSGVIRISATAKSSESSPHPYVELDCDGNPVAAK